MLGLVVLLLVMLIMLVGPSLYGVAPLAYLRYPLQNPLPTPATGLAVITSGATSWLVC